MINKEGMNTKRDWTVGTKVELTFGKLAGKKGTIVAINKRNVSVIVELENGMEVEEGMMYIEEIKEASKAADLTDKEVKVATVIQETMNAYDDNFSDVMIENIVEATGLNVRTVKGTLGSLHKKGYTFEEDVNGEYNVYYLTSEGFKALTGDIPEYL